MQYNLQWKHNLIQSICENVTLRYNDHFQLDVFILKHLWLCIIPLKIKTIYEQSQYSVSQMILSINCGYIAFEELAIQMNIELT